MSDASIRLKNDMTYTYAEVRKLLDGISADARRRGLEVVGNPDGTMGLRATAAERQDPCCTEYATCVPLTDDQIDACIQSVGSLNGTVVFMIEFARAIERAHGITGTP